MPEQEYRTGSWGYVSGAKFLPRGGEGPMPSSALDILGNYEMDKFISDLMSKIEYRLINFCY